MDLAPALTKEKELVRAFLLCHGANDIIQVKTASAQAQKSCMERLVQRMCDGQWVSVDAARHVCAQFFLALTGRTWTFDTPQPVPSNPNPPKQIIFSTPAPNKPVPAPPTPTPTPAPKPRSKKWIAGLAAVLVLILLISLVNSCSGGDTTKITVPASDTPLPQSQSPQTSQTAQTTQTTQSGSSANAPSGVTETHPIATEPRIQVINIDAIPDNIFSIDPIPQQEISCADVDFITHTGNINTDGQTDKYTLSVPRDGRYRLDISGLTNNSKVHLYVYDSAGTSVASNTYCENSDGITLKGLKAGETYKVQVRHCSGHTPYTLTIGQQKPSTAISKHTRINDSIEYVDQRNVYIFTVPRDGRYRFELAQLHNNAKVDLYVFNSLGETVDSYTYCENGQGLTLKGLTAGEVYSVQVRYRSGYSSYTLLIGPQKTPISIADYTRINDSIEYVDQRNVYPFTVPRDGRYRLEIAQLRSGCKVNLHVFNELGETVDEYTYCENGDGITLKGLVAGEEYNVQVRYCTGTSDYSLLIGQQKAPVLLSRECNISDSVQYVAQRNVYLFTVPESGTYRASISGLNAGCGVALYAFNDLWETVDSYTNATNGDSITLSNLQAGETYEIQVRQENGLSAYKLELVKN